MVDGVGKKWIQCNRKITNLQFTHTNPSLIDLIWKLIYVATIKRGHRSLTLLWFKFKRQIDAIRWQSKLSWNRDCGWLATKISESCRRWAHLNQAFNFSAIPLQPKELSKSWSRSLTADYRRCPEVCRHLEVAFHLYLNMLDIRRRPSRVQRPPEDDTEPHLHR